MTIGWVPRKLMALSHITSGLKATSHCLERIWVGVLVNQALKLVVMQSS